MSDIFETAIPILGGLYLTLIGHRVIGRGNKYESLFRILGPFLMLLGAIWLIQSLVRYYA